MKIESMALKNFKVFKDVEMNNIPSFCIIVGANGTGKSTIFSIFAFLQNALIGNVNTAMSILGGSRGFQEVRSRETQGPVGITLKFRERNDSPLITYSLDINEQDGRAYVEKEILQYRRGSSGQPWQFLNFSNGEGEAVINEWEKVQDQSKLDREPQKLKDNDILAIKGLSQFERFPAVIALSNLIENWHISDFHITKARPEQEAGYAEHLSREGENLSLVIEYIYKQHPDIFKRILDALKSRVPGITRVESKTTEEGRVLLKFKDGAFQDPFLARHVSDGTIKMLAYLTLLYDPKPHPLLCVEEPENQLYPKLMLELAEEFRAYSNRGGQVFVTTHSTDFLDAARLNEVFCLVKKAGYARIQRVADDEQIRAYMENGDKMGYLWNTGLFSEADPS